MQFGLPFEDNASLSRIHQRLVDAYGPLPATHRLDPVSQLVHSVLGARTRDRISPKTFALLANRFPVWEELIRAPYWDLAALIRDVTFAERKAKFIPLALCTIAEQRGRLELDFLSAWPEEASLAWLDALPGVGPKTAAAVLNFSTLHKRALVVDTHYRRVAQRLRLISTKTSLACAPRLLTRQIPGCWTANDTEMNFLLMKKLGQEYCRHSKPDCAACPLLRLCPEADSPAAQTATATFTSSHNHGRHV
jgi:endonuclease III